MAQLWNDIKITTCEGRPCWVNGRRAIFHRWTDSARPVKQAVTNEDGVEHFQKYSVHGLVEYEDGTVDRECPNVIQFADSWEHFQQFNWDAMEHHRDTYAARPEIADKLAAVDETAQRVLAEKAMEYLKDMDLPPVNIEAVDLSPYCDNCAYENPLLWADQCKGSGYSCPDCTATGCICKHCEDGDKWEPKGGAV